MNYKYPVILNEQVASSGLFFRPAYADEGDIRSEGLMWQINTAAVMNVCLFSLSAGVKQAPHRSAGEVYVVGMMLSFRYRVPVQSADCVSGAHGHRRLKPSRT